MSEIKGVITGGSLSGKISGEKALNASLRVGSTNTSNDHNLALNRDLPDQHPIEAITGLDDALDNRFDDAWVEEGYLILKRGEDQLRLGPFAGGGGGSGNNAVLTVTNMTGWLSKTISEGASCVLSLDWSSTVDNIPTGGGTMTITVGGAVKLSKNIDQGSVSVDIAEFLSSGTNKVKFKITDEYDNSRTINFTINMVALRITSYFSAESAFDAGTPVTYTYTPVGAVEKTVHFIVDGSSVGTSVVTISGAQQSFSLPAMTHGAHSLLVYFTAEIDGEEVKSNELYYELIVVDSESSVPIIASTFRGTTASQYETLSIPYTVYTPNRLNSIVKFYANNEQLGTDQTIDRTEHVWSYRTDVKGQISLSIATGTTVRTFVLTVVESEIDVEAVTNDLALYLSSYGRSNNETDPSIWEDSDHNISASLTNFNYVSDGWQTDDDGITVLRVSGDARVTIPYMPFETDFRATGKTFEFEFATRDVRNYDATLVSCMSGGRGVLITAQRASFSSQASAISTQYKENEHVRISFVIEKTNENRLIYVYINGIMSGVVQYQAGANENFAQLSPVEISIGSSYCTTDIYNIRIYDNDLTRRQILENWIADTQNISTMLSRYERNSVYDPYGSVTIANLPNDLPYLVLSCPELPQFKGDKKTVSGYYVDPVDGSKSFSFTGAQADVQGTSSQYYPRKNYKIKFNGGFTMTSTEETVSKFAMRNDSIPTKTFTFKADVASSEGANNVELARLYNDVCPYQTPPQKEDSRVRQGIDGFPIVIFWDNGSSVSFVGKYNFNNDKGTEEVFGFADGDESWEIKNNTGNRVLWKDADYTGTAWLNDFEGRYPDGNEDPRNLSALAAWLVTTDQTAATGNALATAYTDVDGNTHTVDNAAYRLAKFKTEVWDHMEKDSTIFYYLFTELFLMVDSRAKNAFPSFLGSDKWCWFPYDFDTAIGINNEGALVFDYSLEDIDTTAGGADIFNGQQSVLWINLRQAFYDDIKSMYQTLRSQKKLSYEGIERAFEEHQGKWPEAIFNEDAWFKYIDPFVGNAENYLDMAQGSKAEQRKWWLYNRFRYIDSKYNAGDAQSDVITLRGYAKDNISVTPYADIYPAVKYGSYLVEKRGKRNVETTLECPLDSVNDTEIYIYSASQLASIGDLSGLKVGLAELSNATKLQNLKLGDANENYSNSNMYALTLGNNTLLRTLDVRNCIGLGDNTLEGHTQTSVDISGCTNIEHVYFGGTSIKALTLPNGGILKTLQLPSTITSLVIRNQPSLSSFSIDNNDYTNITSLWVENAGVYVPYRDILETMPANSNVRLINASINVDTAEEAEAFIGVLDSMKGLDERGLEIDKAIISGTMVVDDVLTKEWVEYTQTQYPDLTIVPTSIVSEVVGYLSNTLPRWINNTASTIHSYAFYNRTALTAVTTAATSIGSYAFGKCTSLPMIELISDDSVTIAANAFNGSMLRHLVIRSNSICTLANVSAFNNTPISAGLGAIYVNEELLDEYKSTTNWSALARQIYPIEAYPVTDFSSIKDSWEEILSNPNYATDYQVGDTKSILLSTGSTVYMQIAAFDKDILSSDGTSTAKITWVTNNIFAKHRMNSTATTGISATDAQQYNTGLSGWPSTEMRYWLRETVMPTIPEVVRNNIKEVNKTYHDLSSSSTLTYTDTIWMPSGREVFGGTSYENDGVIYNGLFVNDTARIKRLSSTGEASGWSLRSAYIARDFRSVTTSGAMESKYGTANTAYGVVFGFCT